MENAYTLTHQDAPMKGFTEIWVDGVCISRTPGKMHICQGCGKLLHEADAHLLVWDSGVMDNPFDPDYQAHCDPCFAKDQEEAVRLWANAPPAATEE